MEYIFLIFDTRFSKYQVQLYWTGKAYVLQVASAAPAVAVDALP